MTSPGISLIIPVYNAARFLREAIDSALYQTAPPRQIIVVDDGSTDSSVEIARSYGQAVVAISQANSGCGAARNRGLAEADQPFITFLDADDRLVPHKLDRQLQSLSENPDAMLCLCKIRDFWSPEIPDAVRGGKKLSPQFRPGQVSTWLARREVFETVGNFNTTSDFRLTEGSELYSRVAGARLPEVRTDEVLIERRLHAKNSTMDSKGYMNGIMALMKRRLELRRNSA